MGRRLLLNGLVLLALTSGCAAVTAAFVIEDLLADRDQRLDLFETTLGEMDLHLDYVDEFMTLAENHVPALHRFVTDTVAVLDDPVVAGVFALALTGSPVALGEVVGQTLGLAVEDDVAGAAFALVLGGRAPEMADLLSSHPVAMEQAVTALVQQATLSADAHVAFTSALASNAEELAAVIAQDPVAFERLTAALAASTPAPAP